MDRDGPLRDLREDLRWIDADLAEHRADERGAEDDVLRDHDGVTPPEHGREPAVASCDTEAETLQGGDEVAAPKTRKDDVHALR